MSSIMHAYYLDNFWFWKQKKRITSKNIDTFLTAMITFPLIEENEDSMFEGPYNAIVKSFVFERHVYSIYSSSVQNS